MATIIATTPFGVTEASRDLFSHSTISRRFTQLNIALSKYIEFERDLEAADCFDLAFQAWIADAEAARKDVLRVTDAITASPLERLEDRPLKRSALLTRALIVSDNEVEFTALHRLLDSFAPLFACCASGAVGARVRQMLETCHSHLDAIAELGEFDDSIAAWTEPSSDAEPDTLIATCVI
ncbi:hypothetical protein K7H20_23100 [Salipiger manganoxidans]|uniref:hypothetical protein n=1 Tax=Salipiger marinus TaxID=555512 RepID=UPI001E378347|nr:hypothetical protein [Salipiger manganoxidans]MCD1620945.1 hypothetical protein [Salipiger manganoxidans]